MQIDHRQISAEALRGLIEEFVTREGTEYGEREYDLEAKCRDVRAQLDRGEACVTYDAETGTATIAPADSR